MENITKIYFKNNETLKNNFLLFKFLVKNKTLTDFFKTIKNKFFPQKINNWNEPIFHEPIKESDADKEKLIQFINSSRFNNLLQTLKHSYQLAKIGELSENHIYIHKSNGAYGFYLSFNKNFETNDFSFLAKYFRLKTLELAYALYSSEKIIVEKAQKIEETEKHYLKPNLVLDEDKKMNQQFGNVLIECVKIESKPSYLKVLITFYNDFNFSKNLNPDDFITNHLLTLR